MTSRKVLWKNQNGRCGFCNCETHLRKDNERMKPHHATTEHIIPKSKGGSNRPANLMMSCYKCNSDRGDMPALMWYKIVNDPKRLKAYRRMVLLRKKLSKIRKCKRRIIKLYKKFGPECVGIAAYRQKLANLGALTI